MVKVSVVMPVHNTGLYVRDALMSILGQTLKDIEVIVVDDGSTDDSVAIVSELAIQDHRIKFLKQPENMGQAAARNLGLQNISGEYVYFMDSDDLLRQDALACCYERCESMQLDAVIFEADVILEDHRTHFSFDYHYKELKEEEVYKGIQLMDFLMDTYQFNVSPCMLLIRSVLFQKWSPVFYPGIIHEDQLFAVLFYINSSRIGYIRQSFFQRRIRPESTMTRKMSRRNRVGYQTVFTVLEEWERKGSDVQVLLQKHRHITLNAFLYTAWSLPLVEKFRFLFFCRQGKYLREIRLRNIAIFFLKWQK